jgi:single-stranded DNA-binding protein
MNNLNSVIIEGEITTPRTVVNTTGKDVFYFTIGCSWTFTRETAPVKETHYFTVKWSGSLAETLQAKIKPGAALRAVGRLIQERNGTRTRVVIEAEHVEFREIKPAD